MVVRFALPNHGAGPKRQLRYPHHRHSCQSIFLSFPRSAWKRTGPTLCVVLHEFSLPHSSHSCDSWFPSPRLWNYFPHSCPIHQEFHPVFRAKRNGYIWAELFPDRGLL